MSHGTIMQIGSPNEIYWRPNARFIAEFMGRANWLRGRLVAGGATGTLFRSVHGWEMPVPAVSTLPDGEIDLCVRPETFDVLPMADGVSPFGLSGVIEDVVPLGAVRQLDILLGGAVRIQATQPNRPDRPFDVGQKVALGVQGHDTLFFPVTATD
jgi:putative spermidine/putrescine transport system ATP-binding protein/putrescine transport system ATP-binding protein